MAAPLGEIDSVYRRALRLARDRNFQLMRQGVGRMYRSFAEVLNRLAAEEATGIITAERARSLRNEVDALLRALQRELVRATEESVGRTLLDVVELHRRVTNELVRRYGPIGVTLSSFDRVPIRALAAMASRPGAVTFQTLIGRHIQALAPDVDRFLDAAVARGVSVGRASKDLARLMARDDPRLTRLLDRPEIFEGHLHRGAGAIEWGAYGLDEADLSDVQGILYDARRIVVTETNGAHREANAAAMTESPIVIAAQWQLSGRHHIEDECDMLAEVDAYGYGPGYYPPSEWPIHPHPHCQCYSGRALFRRPSEWTRPKPPPNPLAIDASDPALSTRWARNWTDRERQRNQASFEAAIRVGQRSRRAA